jgi:hypothetical protein
MPVMSGHLATDRTSKVVPELGHHSNVLSRRFIAICCALLVSAGLAMVGAAAGAKTSVVLGKKHLLAYGIGWGTAHPRLIFNGGDPSGKAWHLRWRNWGAPSASARGLTWIFRPKGGYYRKPGAIELRASRIGRCTPHGPRAYTRLRARVAVRPGGHLTHWFAWGGWKSTCTGPP